MLLVSIITSIGVSRVDSEVTDVDLELPDIAYAIARGRPTTYDLVAMPVV
jgi:hypothetical protein